MKTAWKVGELVMRIKDSCWGKIVNFDGKEYMVELPAQYRFSPEEMESYLRKPTEEELERRRLFLEKLKREREAKEAERKQKEEEQARLQAEKKLSPKEKLKRRRIVEKEQLFASKTLLQVIELLFDKHDIKPSAYSYHSGTKERADNVAQDYGTSLVSLSRYGMVHQDSDDIREGCEDKAYAPKGTAATFYMEELSETEKDLFDRFRTEFPFAVSQKQNSSWGSDKTTLNRDSFWFPYVLKLIELGRLKPVASEDASVVQ